MMPERDVEETIKRLTPLLTDPDLEKKVDEAAGKTATVSQAQDMQTEDPAAINEEFKEKRQEDKKDGRKDQGKGKYIALDNATGNNSMLSQVVGIIVGSPEFQRR